MQFKFKEESSHIRPPIKGLQGVEYPPYCGSPLSWNPTGAGSENKYMNPKAGHVTLQSDPTPWTLFLEASVAWRFTHTRHETQVPLPSWSPLPPPSLFPRPPAEEHMSPITVLLSQHTIKAERQTLLLSLYLSGHSCAS